MEVSHTLYEVLTVVNFVLLIALLLVIRPVLKLIPNIKHILTMWGRGTIQAKIDKVRTKEQQEDARSAKQKIAEEVKKRVPLGLAEKLSAEEMFALITDADFVNFIRGIAVTGNAIKELGGSLITKLQEAKENKPVAGARGVPVAT